ncbi:MAG: hypothetical protein JNK82_25545 [Myxococcaceae bacterium]|nr:hypothetical protein [Myxococcaceae bacterium]
MTVLVVVASADVLGPPVRHETFTLRPPKSFRVARLDLFRSSRVGAVAKSDDTPRRLLSVLVDTDGEDAAALLVASVDEPFKAASGARDELSAAVARHFSNELSLKFALERVELVPGPSPRVEVVGSVREGSQLRQIVVAAWPGEAKHAVVMVSVPSGRWAELEAPIRASLDSFHVDVAGGSRSRTVAWAALALVASALMASVGLWRRRRSSR